MGPDDPVFFDPDADTPQPLEANEKDLADAMAAVGIHPRPRGKTNSSTAASRNACSGGYAALARSASIAATEC